jgi:lincosamide nucleotidyltransferase A/C/D/E
MPAAAAVDLLRLFESAGIDVWLDGGWAVDAALGGQTRSHKDLDIIVQISDLPRLQRFSALEDSGLRKVVQNRTLYSPTATGSRLTFTHSSSTKQITACTA